MEIVEKVVKLRYHILGALVLCLTLISLLVMASSPRLMSLFTYFWPLFLSTALVLALVIFFAKTPPFSPTDASSFHNAAQGLLDYVAGHHDPPFDARHKSD
uniref:Transmembrane protein n=2 Tax=Cajanus cajan TaxID=3821 RepID=A0A151U2L0_CAJCA|nr:hypothetical protein KK1_006093 [Cajanus cajan]